MKILIGLAILGIAQARTPIHPCQCWPNWQPINENNEWHCKHPQSQKIFHCNIDIPPICECKNNGNIVKLPLGELNCVSSGRNYDNITCESTPEWEKWFNKYPQ